MNANPKLCLLKLLETNWPFLGQSRSILLKQNFFLLKSSFKWIFTHMINSSKHKAAKYFKYKLVFLKTMPILNFVY